jgi:hypothetical protein
MMSSLSIIMLSNLYSSIPCKNREEHQVRIPEEYRHFMIHMLHDSYDLISGGGLWHVIGNATWRSLEVVGMEANAVVVVASIMGMEANAVVVKAVVWMIGTEGTKPKTDMMSRAPVTWKRSNRTG